MNIIESIQHRRSVRTFDGTDLSSEEQRQILDFAQRVENPFDQTIQWKILDASQSRLSVPVITGTNIYLAGKMLQAPYAEEAFGYTLEKIVLYAEALGYGTTWIAGTMDRAAFEREMKLSEGEVMPCITPVGRPARKMSLRESLMRKGVKADSRMDFGTLFYKNSFDQPLTRDQAGPLSGALELVRLGPSAVNKQPWRIVVTDNAAHFYEHKAKGFGEDGWDIQKIDIGIALAHFEIGAGEAGLKPVLKIEDPKLDLPENTRYIASFIW